MHNNFKDDFELKNDFEDEEFFLDVPDECPKCGSELELDTDYDKTMLICSNVDCDYEFDATEEFKRAAIALGLDEDEYEEDDEDEENNDEDDCLEENE